MNVLWRYLDFNPSKYAPVCSEQIRLPYLAPRCLSCPPLRVAPATALTIWMFLLNPVIRFKFRLAHGAANVAARLFLWVCAAASCHLLLWATLHPFVSSPESILHLILDFCQFHACLSASSCVSIRELNFLTRICVCVCVCVCVIQSMCAVALPSSDSSLSSLDLSLLPRLLHS